MKLIYTSLPQGSFPGETLCEVFDLGEGKYRAIRTSFGQPFESDCYLDNGAIRWVSNNACAPLSSIKEMHLNEIPGYDADTHKRILDAELDAFLTEYRANYQPPSPEELYEMRAAFGEGAKVVNVITGHITEL